MEKKEAKCPICIGVIVEGVNLCLDKSHESVCRECISSFIQNAVETSFFGACPSIICPSITHSNVKKRRVLLYDEWKHVVPPTVSSKYASLANSLLAFLCGGCHSLKSLDVGSDCDPSSSNQLYLTKYFDTPERSAQVYFEELKSFVSGESTVEVFYQRVNVHFPLLLSMGDFDAWDVFVNVLKGVSDPERRANLHLRYLRDHPRIKTACCSREHCFKCKTKDFHEGKSCIDNASTLDHSVICCPTCGISLAKGDGCNTVTCVCGKQFSWSAEKENTERCALFVQANPENTSVICAEQLCTLRVAGDLMQAKAWQIRHRVEVNRALLLWFKTKYWPCPSQCCVVLALDRLPEGVKEAADLWRAEHKKEVEKCAAEKDCAVSALFSAFYPFETERPAGAFKLINQARRGTRSATGEDPAMVASAAKWVETHRESYLKGVEQLELRSALQFLFLFGGRAVSSTRPSSVNSPCSLEWDRATSNPDLTYTNDNSSVERVGSVSCYPAAFAAISSERAMFRVVVETAPKSSNWLTFGVAAKGMANSSSDGIGRTPNTWGLSDDRSAASGNSILAANGTEVSNFRKLRVGDELSAVIDTLEGWVEVAVNDQELHYKFDIPPGPPSDYFFAMTFANDHRVSILCDVDAGKKTAAAPLRGVLNSDHTRMFHALRKHVKALLLEETDVPGDSAVVRTLRAEQRWIQKWGGDPAVAEQRFKEVEAEIYGALNIKADPSATRAAVAADKPLTWNDLVAAVCWFRENRQVLAYQRLMDVATAFYGLHGDDAPFMAAINLVEYHTHKVEREEHQASLAFMKVFPELAEEWYAYDFHSREPVIENVAKDCLCLPRHCKVCPKPTKRG